LVFVLESASGEIFRASDFDRAAGSTMPSDDNGRAAE